MKKLLFLLTLMLSPVVASAQTVSDVQNSGCTARARGAGHAESVPTIILKKEGSVLWVEVQNFISTCDTNDFIVKSSMNEGNDEVPCSLTINIFPVTGEEPVDCVCPYNVSFTVRDLEPNSFYLKCWWYEGMVELTEGKTYQATDGGSFSDTFEINGIYYELFANSKTATVVPSPDHYSGDIVIPESVTYNGDTYKVTSIGDWTFYDCSDLTSVTIPNSVTTIGENAFAFCSGLTSVTIPNSVTSIGKKAFYGCFGLTSVTIPNSITSIGSGVFQSCSGLTSIVIPNSVTSIGDNAFYSCSGLTSVTIGNSVTSIGDNAFAYCSCLTSVTIPNSVTSIGGSAFSDCSSLASITIPNSVTSIGSSAFYWCSCLTSVTIPNSLTSIDSNVFCGCASLTSITIPNSVKSISFGAFRRCYSLTSVTIPNSVTSIDIYAFEYCYGLTSVTIGNNVMNIGRNAFSECSDLTSVTVLNPTPIAITQDVFTSRKNATLYVPATSIDSYRNVSPWNEFGAIVPIEDQVAYRPFLKEGKTWNVVSLRPVDSAETDTTDYYDILGRKGRVNQRISYVIDGDTVIGGVAYKKLLSNGYFVCGLREEDGRVYQATSSERLLYDFNAQIGDVFMNGNGSEKLQVNHVLKVDVNGQSRRCLEMYHYYVGNGVEYYSGGKDYWIEGVGCTGSLIDPFWWGTLSSAYPLLLSCYEDGECIYTCEDFNNQINSMPDIAYRPMIEDGKVWKVGSTTGISDGVVKMVEYYYFDGDTIIDGKTCKQMMCQRYVSPDHPDYDVMIQIPSLRNIGAWYEEDKKVYLYNAQSKQYKMMYDFSLEANETFLIDDYYSYVIGPKQTGGLDGFKGVYRDVMWYDEEEPYYNTTWLEGVGGIDGPTVNVYSGKEGHGLFLMSCSVGDEVIYLNDDYEDGASIDAAGARKDRFDFVHIVKPRPKAPSKQEKIMVKASMREAEEPIYGEYNEQQLDINLNPLADAYMVSITNESGKVVYEKAINAGSIVGLNIDISAYAKGRYTVTMENSLESFTGEFEVQTTGIEEVIDNNKVKASNTIFNLQGQRISSLQKGLNIVNGRKVVIK